MAKKKPLKMARIKDPVPIKTFEDVSNLVNKYRPRGAQELLQGYYKIAQEILIRHGYEPTWGAETDYKSSTMPEEVYYAYRMLSDLDNIERWVKSNQIMPAIRDTIILMGHFIDILSARFEDDIISGRNYYNRARKGGLKGGAERHSKVELKHQAIRNEAKKELRQGKKRSAVVNSLAARSGYTKKHIRTILKTMKLSEKTNQE